MDKELQLIDRVKMNFQKDEVITLTVALLLEIYSDDYEKINDYLDRCIDLD